MTPIEYSRGLSACRLLTELSLDMAAARDQWKLRVPLFENSFFLLCYENCRDTMEENVRSLLAKMGDLKDFPTLQCFSYDEGPRIQKFFEGKRVPSWSLYAQTTDPLDEPLADFSVYPKGYTDFPWDTIRSLEPWTEENKWVGKDRAGGVVAHLTETGMRELVASSTVPICVVTKFQRRLVKADSPAFCLKGIDIRMRERFH